MNFLIGVMRNPYERRCGMKIKIKEMPDKETLTEFLQEMIQGKLVNVMFDIKKGKFIRTK